MIALTHIIRNKIAAAMHEANRQLQNTLYSDASPRSVAFAFALGTFINLLPIPGADIVLSMTLLKGFRRLQRAPVLAAMAVWNGFVSTPVIVAGGKMGTAMMDASPLPHGGQSELLTLVQQIALGNMTTAGLVSTVCFVGAYSAVRYVRRCGAR